MKSLQFIVIFKRIKLKSLSSFTLIFMILLCFYLFKQKLYLFDTDDWINITNNRSFLPKWGGFNPAKVLPETLLPIVTYIGHFLIYPFIHDLVISSHITYSIFLSVLITANVICFVKVAEVNNFCIKVLLYIFVLFALATFCYHDGFNKEFLLSNVSVTTIFHYNISVLLNSLAVFYLISIRDSFTLKQSKKKTTIQALALYYVIFSNLYANVILVSYSSSILLLFIFKKILLKNNRSLISIVPHLYCSLLWLISAIFEYNGGRAKGIETNFSDYILSSIKYVGIVYKTINSTLLIFFLLISFIAIITICIYKNNNKILKMALGGVLTSLISWAGLIVYLCVLGSKTGPGYLLSSATRLAFYFYPLLISFYLLSIIFRYFKKSSLIFIVTSSIILIYQFGMSMNTIRYTNFQGIAPDLAYSIIEDMHSQLLINVKEGKQPIIIKVPKLQCGADDNWPLALYGGKRFAKAFYRYGDLDHKIEATFVVDYDKNIKFGLTDDRVNCVR